MHTQLDIYQPTTIKTYFSYRTHSLYVQITTDFLKKPSRTRVVMVRYMKTWHRSMILIMQIITAFKHYHDFIAVYERFEIKSC